MHCSSLEIDGGGRKSEGDVLVAVASMVVEGRIPGKLKSKGFYEGPHCPTSKTAQEHHCDPNDNLCKRYEGYQRKVISLWQRSIPLCIEVLLVATCTCEDVGASISCPSEPSNDSLILEQWYFNISHNRSRVPFNFSQLINAIRSQLHFSQISAWLDSKTDTKLSNKNLKYRISVPDEMFEMSEFTRTAVKHDFPITDIGSGSVVNVAYYSLPRTATVPIINCQKCAPRHPPIDDKCQEEERIDNNILDDRMHTSCTLKGKHRCEDFEDLDAKENQILTRTPRCRAEEHNHLFPSTSSNTRKPKPPINLDRKHQNENVDCKIRQQNIKNDEYNKNDLNNQKNNGQILLEAILRSGQKNTNGVCAVSAGGVKCDEKHVQDIERPLDVSQASANACGSDSNNSSCDKSESDIFNYKNKSFKIYDENCDSSMPIPKHKKIRDISNIDISKISSRVKSRQKITFDDPIAIKTDDKDGLSCMVDVPSASEQAKFRKNLDSAASMVFHSRTGLPLTSSPAPVRRGKSCFDFDSSITSVSAIKSALYSSSSLTDDDSESDGSSVSPCSPDVYTVPLRELSPVKYPRRGHANNLLGTFEESVLNGRLKPVSTVQGFRAELGASGSFVPRHLVVPVTVFFYTFGDNDKVSSPYLGHINLGRKGYNVPKEGTVQVTLFNPLGTVVKMFVIMYNLRDMPCNSQTFIRQRTLYMPTNCTDKNLEWSQKWLRYLIHLRFMSSKSGRIYLHSDIRMIICRKSDLDTATAHGIDMSYELRSFIQMPSNPRYSPRK